jgi:cellobiose PTS system EIIA component
MMEPNELISFQIISAVGTARSYYIEAIQVAKTGDFEGASKLMEEGDEFFLKVIKPILNSYNKRQVEILWS